MPSSSLSGAQPSQEEEGGEGEFQTNEVVRMNFDTNCNANEHNRNFSTNKQYYHLLILSNQLFSLFSPSSLSPPLLADSIIQKVQDKSQNISNIVQDLKSDMSKAITQLHVL